MALNNKKESAIDLWERAIIERSVRFSVSLRVSHYEVWRTDFEVKPVTPYARADALKLARQKAKTYNRISPEGRRALIIAVNPEGQSALVSG